MGYVRLSEGDRVFGFGRGWKKLGNLKTKKGLSFISNRQRRKEGTCCASGLAGIEPTPPAPEEQGMCAFRQLG
jgi:hypothetical protein